MRLVVVILLLVSSAHADTRVGFHAGGGLEGGFLRDLHPEGVVEAGLVAEHIWPDKRWGLAAGFERIGRGYDDVADEWKLDAGLCLVNPAHTAHIFVGVGFRSLTVPGGDNRLPSTIHGIDLIRLEPQMQIFRRGAIALDFYFGWTFGIYHGRQYNERLGDMVQTSRGISAMTTAYVLGLQTTVALD